MRLILRVLTINIFLLTSLLAEKYDIEKYLDQVRMKNKFLKIARQDLQMAKANKKEALSLALPKVVSSAGYTRNLSANYMYMDNSLFGGEGISKVDLSFDNEYTFQTAISQTLFSFTVGNALKAARQYEKMTGYVYNTQYQSLITSARKVFYQTLLLKKVLEVTHLSEENAKENYLKVKQKFENGIVSEFNLIQAEVRWKNLVPETAQAKKNFELALNNLKNLAGIPIEYDMEPEGTLTRFPELPKLMEFERILETRPDFNALKWEKDLRKTAVKTEFSNYLPSLDASLVYRFHSQSDEWQFDHKNQNYIAGLQLSIPIYTGGYTGAQVKKARIELERTKIRIDKTKDDIFNEVKNIWLRLDEADKRIISAKKNVEAAEKAFKIAQTSSENGLATQLELKDSRVIFDQSKLNYYKAVYDYLEAYFDWNLATGLVK